MAVLTKEEQEYEFKKNHPEGIQKKQYQFSIDMRVLKEQILDLKLALAGNAQSKTYQQLQADLNTKEETRRVRIEKYNHNNPLNPWAED